MRILLLFLLFLAGCQKSEETVYTYYVSCKGVYTVDDIDYQAGVSRKHVSVDGYDLLKSASSFNICTPASSYDAEPNTRVWVYFGKDNTFGVRTFKDL